MSDNALLHPYAFCTFLRYPVILFVLYYVTPVCELCGYTTTNYDDVNSLYSARECETHTRRVFIYSVTSASKEFCLFCKNILFILHRSAPAGTHLYLNNHSGQAERVIDPIIYIHMFRLSHSTIKFISIMGTQTCAGWLAASCTDYLGDDF